ncbi:uncharacterized protein RCC_00827 [Ramularia collo-cygni]|uniref:polynucleotide adenylyltransferase n=1 Tax=Ramularia collo-cygni TaxID=112498 RepID=A0A2D3UNE1_9PEZI|nr:uncharacterized protein RCC_00827 [Ramularia collo-cygni]CZT14888.1 uncharacterized protein RCC_00827 [Ramularia collo-cygni]
MQNHSPRSVVSEAVTTGNTIAAPPRFCKYETGDEIRRRRIPYLQEYAEALGPPRREPKATLDPQEQDKLSGDMRELYDRLLPSEESEERRAKLLVKLERILNDEWPGHDIRVNVFGSSGNLLSSTDSDVDVCITTSMKNLGSMHSLAQLLARHGMEKIVCRAAAKVPIVKYWDPDLKLHADLNVNNTLALQNTRMIKAYVQLDDRVRPLAKIIKYWTKRRILNDAAFGGTISSYTWICMIISFLQRRNPPILPSLQKIQDHRLQADSPFADDIEALKSSDTLKGYGSSNKESLGELLFQFFRHYGYEFVYPEYVVSVREGRTVRREEKGWEPSNHSKAESRNALCVEEPFTQGRNLGNSADDYAWHGIHSEIRRACDLLGDELMLSKCCEQYEFPPEEKVTFQKPARGPKPTLTRSASQSGRAHHEPGPARQSRKKGQHQQKDRVPGNRRASSGGSYANRIPPFSPPVGANPSDYFHVKGNLHEALYQQYQYLQLQQDALRNQLVHQQAAQAQVRSGESPRTRSYANGLASSRFGDAGPQTAPLLPGYLYHYPARYAPQPANASQSRAREGTNTNPSSPSLVAAVPALRRQVHRSSVTDGPASAGRSQSQPGRSLPHPLTMQQVAHPGWDVSGALGGQLQAPRTSSQAYQNGHPMLNLPLPPLPGGRPGNQPLENAMPKEYVGYYVGQSPQLPPQYGNLAQIPPPPMALNNPPFRQRRVTPDLVPPAMNGRHTSRSPSPLGDLHKFPSMSEISVTSPQLQQLQSPIAYEQRQPAPFSPSPDMDLGGPLIVNGSNRHVAPQQPAERVNGVMPGVGLRLSNEAPIPVNDVPLPVQPEEFPRMRAWAPHQSHESATSNGSGEVGDRRAASPRISPTSKPKPDLGITLSPNGTAPHSNGVNGHFHESTQLPAPLLSPVAELRTPSPTQSRSFDIQAARETTNNLTKAVKINNARQVTKENHAPPTESRHERKVSATNKAAPSRGNAVPNGTPVTTQQNQWQQAPSKKGHKKSKSHGGHNSPNRSGGQPLPVNESERKGG